MAIDGINILELCIDPFSTLSPTIAVTLMKKTIIVIRK